MRRWINRGLITLGVLTVLSLGGYFAFVSSTMNFGPPDDRSAWLDHPATISSGDQAYIQRDVAGAMDIWREVSLDESASAQDRAEALQLLSRTSWRIYQDTDQGIAFALAADDVANTFSANAVALSDAYREAGDYDAALIAARTAIARASDPLERNASANTFARAALASTKGLRLDQLTDTNFRILEEAHRTLLPFLAQPPANLATSELALKIAVRLDDGPAMLQAWGSYYHSPTGRSSMADQSGPAEMLNAELPQWQGPNSPMDMRRNVALALANSHFYALAALIATDERSADSDALLREPEIAEIVAVTDYLVDLRLHTDEYYRRIAVASTNSVVAEIMMTSSFIRGRSALERNLWQSLSAYNDLGNYSHRAFVAEASERFQLYIGEGPTSGVYDSHMGHRVLDTTVVADQFGRTAELGFIVIGRMVSNGYESWLWDGRQQHGGWANSEAIHQVRPAYAEGPLRRWYQVTDPDLRAEREAEIERLTAQDAEIASQTPIAFFAGLDSRLEWQALNGILADARANNPPELVRQAFILELGQATFNYSILAHEGRHALDKNYAAPWIGENSAELEFRAKLSEVVFGDWPRLAFGAIFNRDLGSDTPHGIANERIAQGLVVWMEDHSDEIEGLDSSIALLPQFDLLTDDQIRSAILSQDPWAEDYQISGNY